MHVTIDPSLETDESLRAAVASRSGLLEGIINGTAAAEWRKGTDWRGQSAAQLRLRDPSGARVGADLLPVEFNNAVRLEGRFRDLRDALRTVRHWRAAVGCLFATMRPWCESLPGDPAVCSNVERVQEEASGEYLVRQLFVIRVSRLMTITPVGAWVLAADGRVDVIGPGDRAILHYFRATDSWFHIPNDAPYRELPLTESLFRELAEACLDD